MEKDELLKLFDQFISENQMFNEFKEFLDEKGYSEEELNEVMNNLD